MDNDTFNGIKPLMREAKSINDSWLNKALDTNPEKMQNLDDENPFIEEENQVATRVGYLYKIWKIQEEKPEIGQKEKKICIRCAVHCHTG